LPFFCTFLHPGSVIQRRPRDGYQEHDRASVTSRKLCYFFTIGPFQFLQLSRRRSQPCNDCIVGNPSTYYIPFAQSLLQSSPQGQRGAQKSTKLMILTLSCSNSRSRSFEDNHGPNSNSRHLGSKSSAMRYCSKKSSLRSSTGASSILST